MPTAAKKDGLRLVLERAAFGIAVQSDFSRLHAKELAEAASRSLVSTESPDRSHGRVWTLTARGRSALDYLRRIA